MHVDERRRKLARARQRFEVAEGREPTLEELARAAEMEPHHAQEAIEAVEATVSLNRPVGDDPDSELGDLLADPDVVDAVEEAERSLRDAGIRRAVAALPERERRVVELRFGFDGESLTLEAIGRELGPDARARPPARAERVREAGRRPGRRGTGGRRRPRRRRLIHRRAQHTEGHAARPGRPAGPGSLKMPSCLPPTAVRASGSCTRRIGSS